MPNKNNGIFTPIKNMPEAGGKGQDNSKSLNLFNQNESLPKSNSSEKHTDSMLRTNFYNIPMNPMQQH